MGYMSVFGGWIDVHGAGAQRSDPKTGNPANYPTGFGPQGDAIRISNYVRLVRNVDVKASVKTTETTNEIRIYPNPSSTNCTVSSSQKLKSIELFNSVGESVLVCNNADYNYNFDTNQFASGIYILKAMDENSHSNTQLLAIRK